MLDRNGMKFEEIECDEVFVEHRCRKCIFFGDTERRIGLFQCQANDYEMPACEHRPDGKTVYFKQIT